MTDAFAERVVKLAASLLETARQVQTASEQADAKQLASMMADPAGKAFTVAMADRVFRSHDPARQAHRLQRLIHQYGIPDYLPFHQRLMLAMGSMAALAMPSVVMPRIESQMRKAASRVILDADPAALSRYLQTRKASGTRVNLNYLGEAVLGEEEAQRRLETLIQYLRHPQIDYISVKISSIFSQINLLDWDGTLAAIKDRLRTLFRAAMSLKKFVNLDMEEYRDLELTLTAFQQVLDEPELQSFSAGIALQAYLPDSWAAQHRLIDWAHRRVQNGGASVKMRLVKGANLAMERLEAELHQWNVAPYQQKVQTDANYRRMMEFGCRPENAVVVRLGVASHNLFDVALALVLRDEFGVKNNVEIEMLEGMANHQVRAVEQIAGSMLVYAPIVRREDFINALAYLVRRLDENTAPENFLHDSFNLETGTQAWERQKQQFLQGWEMRATVPSDSHRAAPAPTTSDGSFFNVPDTDWTQANQRASLQTALRDWRSLAIPELDPLEKVLATAVAAQPSWESLGPAASGNILRNAAGVMSNHRFDTIAQMMHEAKKAPAEADAEVSEAIDYCRYTADTATPLPEVAAKALGVVVVTPPWNFPYAIPCSGVTAALAAGNSVILKPAPETIGVAWHLACHLWEAGVPRDVLQFFPCPDGEIGKSLITDPRASAVVLTGAYETARTFLDWRPSLRLFAETSGKNAIIVTSQADRDLAIKHIIKSAFSHAGQKCSAASLAILEAEIYDDAKFLDALRDAAASLRVGHATEPGSIVTPLIREPSPNLLRALTTLDPGETWLLQPRVDPADPCLWSPGIKLGITPGSWFHQTECFGPVLGVMRAKNLDEAIQFQNDVPFGLTAGIHTLDDSEIARWKELVQAGNAYINRPITGAVVRRQPFGGWKRSSIGPGAKAGGPNYALQFATLRDTPEFPESYQKWWTDYFTQEHDPSALKSESNHFRYRPSRGVLLRLSRCDTESITLATRAAEICRVPLTISYIEAESDKSLAARLPQLAAGAEFLRTLSVPSDILLRAACQAGMNCIFTAALRCGRYELRHWLREQSITETQHRYGLITGSRLDPPR